MWKVYQIATKNKSNRYQKLVKSLWKVNPNRYVNLPNRHGLYCQIAMKESSKSLPKIEPNRYEICQLAMGKIAKSLPVRTAKSLWKQIALIKSLGTNRYQQIEPNRYIDQIATLFHLWQDWTKSLPWTFYTQISTKISLFIQISSFFHHNEL